MASFYEILMTPTFQMHEIDLLSDFWAKLREARGSVKVGGGMLYRMTPTEMEDTWSRVRKVYLERKAQRGHDTSEAARQLEVMVAQRAPFRERVWRSSNLVMRKAERQQRPGFMFFFGLEEWLEQEIQFPQGWFLNWDCTTGFMDI
jgi:hypothetical protein